MELWYVHLLSRPIFSEHSRLDWFVRYGLTELFRTLLCFALLWERLARLVYTYKFSNLGNMA